MDEKNTVNDLLQYICMQYLILKVITSTAQWDRYILKNSFQFEKNEQNAFFQEIAVFFLINPLFFFSHQSAIPLFDSGEEYVK